MKRGIVPLLAIGLSAVVIAQQPAVQPPLVPLAWEAVRPIQPAATPLASEAASAAVTRFSFIAYGDTRSGGVALMLKATLAIRRKEVDVVRTLLGSATDLFRQRGLSPPQALTFLRRIAITRAATTKSARIK